MEIKKHEIWECREEVTAQMIGRKSITKTVLRSELERVLAQDGNYKLKLVGRYDDYDEARRKLDALYPHARTYCSEGAGGRHFLVCEYYVLETVIYDVEDGEELDPYVDYVREEGADFCIRPYHVAGEVRDGLVVVDITIRDHHGKNVIMETNSVDFERDLAAHRDALTQWWGIEVEYSGDCTTWTKWDGRYRTYRDYIDIDGRDVWKRWNISTEDGQSDFYPDLLRTIRKDIYGMN